MPHTTTALTRRDVTDLLHLHDATPSAGPAQVGIEQEWHTYDLADLGRHVHPDAILQASLAGGALPCGSSITVEPGGQVEMATPPVAPWWRALEILRTDGAALRERLALAGIGALAVGVDPFRAPVRTLVKPRYDAMEAYFDQWAPSGRLMMSGCAAIQVNIDHGDATTMARRWDLAHRIGPALAAAFACSPSPTHRSARLAAWWALDPSRTHPVLTSGRLADDWAAYVLAARLMLVHDDTTGGCAPVLTPISFGGWIEHGLDGRRPTEADLAYHCTTLFPPVRPRGWLELRWLDALPSELAAVAIAAIVAVLVDEEAGERAGSACAPVATAWTDAARHGPSHPGLATAGAATLRAAAVALERSAAPRRLAARVADAAERWPARGRCPADDLQDRLQRGARLVNLLDPRGEAQAWT